MMQRSLSKFFPQVEGPSTTSAVNRLVLAPLAVGH
jgi:hypothetical protein